MLLLQTLLVAEQSIKPLHRWHIFQACSHTSAVNRTYRCLDIVPVGWKRRGTIVSMQYCATLCAEL